jgi:predicted ATPase
METIYDTRLKTPFNCIISGASKSGKTTLVRNLLMISEHIFTNKPAHVICYYKFMQDIYRDMHSAGLINELISLDDEEFTYGNILEKIKPYQNTNGSLIIFDDTMTEISDDFEQVFTNLSHHQNTSVIFITQNLFYNDKSYRTMSLNADYFFIMKNARDKLQITNLAKQFCPGNSTYVTQSFMDATKSPFSYLLIDFTQKAPDNLRLRSKIFPHEAPYTVYIDKNG